MKLVLVYTLKCNASCSICCFNCHPNQSGKMSWEAALDYIRQASEIPAFDEVSITGGEALLYAKEVEGLIEAATLYGLKVRLTSNGFWASSIDQALDRLRILKEKGLTALSISTDEFHESFIPYPYIENILLANDIVQLSLKLQRIVTMDSPDHPLQQKYPSQAWQKGACRPVGRAEQTIPKESYLVENLEARCDSSDVLTIFPDGTSYPCCSQLIQNDPLVHNNPLRLGDASTIPLQQLLNVKEKNEFLSVMMTKGPRWLKEAGEAKGIFLQNNHEHHVFICHLCSEMASDDAFLYQMENEIKEVQAQVNFNKYFKIDKG